MQHADLCSQLVVRPRCVLRVRQCIAGHDAAGDFGSHGVICVRECIAGHHAAGDLSSHCVDVVLVAKAVVVKSHGLSCHLQFGCTPDVSIACRGQGCCRCCVVLVQCCSTHLKCGFIVVEQWIVHVSRCVSGIRLRLLSQDTIVVRI